MGKCRGKGDSAGPPLHELLRPRRDLATNQASSVGRDEDMVDIIRTDVAVTHVELDIRSLRSHKLYHIRASPPCPLSVPSHIRGAPLISDCWAE